MLRNENCFGRWPKLSLDEAYQPHYTFTIYEREIIRYASAKKFDLEIMVSYSIKVSVKLR